MTLIPFSVDLFWMGERSEDIHAPVQRKVTVRLTPFQARKLWELRTAGLPEGARPRSATQVIVDALLKQAECAGDRADARLLEVV